jgi:DNA polymerase
MDDETEPDFVPARPPSERRGPMPQAAGALCHECPLSKEGEPDYPVLGEGPQDPDWIIVAEGPGQTERQTGRPFVGPSGELVDKAFKAIGVRRDRVWITNSHMCITSGATDDQKAKAVIACAPRLTKELSAFPGRPILALGAVAAKRLITTSLFKITDIASTHHRADVDGTGERSIIPAVHPAAILRGGAGVAGAHAPDLAFWNLIYDAGKVAALAAGKDILFSEDIETFIDGSPGRVHEAVSRLYVECMAAKFVAIDTETYVDDELRHTALHARMAKIRAIGLATPKRAISVLWNLLAPATRNMIRLLCANKAITKVFHNGIYDRTVLAVNGLPVDGPWEDTLLAHHATFPGMTHKLQQVAAQFFAIRPWKADHRQGDGTDQSLLTYNCLDVLSTARLVAPLTLHIKRTKTERIYEIDRAMAEVAVQMHIDGVPISRDVNAALADRLGGMVARAREKIESTANDPTMRERIWARLAFEQATTKRKKDPDDFNERVALRMAKIEKDHAKGKYAWNIDSGNHVVALLRSQGLALRAKTATGKTSTKQEVLEAFAHIPEVAAVLDYREAEKLLGTFVVSMYDHKDKKGKFVPGYVQLDDRAHPTWNVHRITGRWNAYDPMCFDRDTEILTEDGFVPFPLLQRDQQVAQYDKESHAIEFVQPTGYVDEPHDGPMCRFSGAYADLFVTPEHRMLVRSLSDDCWKVLPAARVVEHQSYMLLVAGYYMGGHEELGDDALSFLVAVNRHGRFSAGTWRLVFRSSRKARQLRSIAERCGMTIGQDLTEGGSYIVTFEEHRLGLWANRLLGKENEIGSWVLDWSVSTRVRFLAAIRFWSEPSAEREAAQLAGSNSGSQHWIQIAATLTGAAACTTSAGFSIRSTDVVGINSLKARTERYVGRKYCVSVPSTFIVVRRFGRVAICGNCQNVSKGNEKHQNPNKRIPNLRRQVVAPHGRAFVGFDLGQVEARTIALLSGDPWLAKVFSDGKDIHSEFCRIVWPKFDENTPEERKRLRDSIKRPEYGAFFAGSLDTLWRSIVRDDPTVKLADVARMVKVMATAMPHVSRWQKACVRRACTPPYEILSPFYGRRRCFPLGNANPSEAINFGVQSGTSDIMATGILRILPRLKKYRRRVIPILQIHDAMVFECDEDDAPKLEEDVMACFPDEHTLNGVTIPYPIDCHIGTNWAEV